VLEVLTRFRGAKDAPPDFMAQTYKIQDGDHTSGIAARFGFADFRTVWNNPNNAELKKKRVDPHVLMPGDSLYIPDKQQKTVARPTGRVHTFIVNRQTLFLKIALKDFDDQPIADTECVLEVDGTVFNLKTDSKGRIEQEITTASKTGILKIPDLEYEFPVKIGYLDPVDEDTGWRARLINLGYHAGPLNGSNKLLLKYAVEEFQCDYKLKVTGTLDASTRAKLKEMHGG
jgi:N-acetylmuramoyl-L-alanine amidase